MRYPIHCLFLALCLMAAAAPAFACEPFPEFPAPPDIANMQLIASRHGELTEDEQAALDAYNTDRTRYMELYEEAYPCPLAAGPDYKRLQAANSTEMIEEMATLTAKWTRPESVPEQAPAPDDEKYIDVPEEGLAIE